jgi:hypothetical protein
MAPPRTDGDIVRIARQLQRLHEQAHTLLARIEESDWQTPEIRAQLVADLDHQCFGSAWPTHVFHAYLEHPERWSLDGGMRYIRARVSGSPGNQSES